MVPRSGASVIVTPTSTVTLTTTTPTTPDFEVPRMPPVPPIGAPATAHRTFDTAPPASTARPWLAAAPPPANSGPPSYYSPRYPATPAPPASAPRGYQSPTYFVVNGCSQGTTAPAGYNPPNTAVPGDQLRMANLSENYWSPVQARH